MNQNRTLTFFYFLFLRENCWIGCNWLINIIILQTRYSLLSSIFFPFYWFRHIPSLYCFAMNSFVLESPGIFSTEAILARSSRVNMDENNDILKGYFPFKSNRSRSATLNVTTWIHFFSQVLSQRTLLLLRVSSDCPSIEKVAETLYHTFIHTVKTMTVKTCHFCDSHWRI